MEIGHFWKSQLSQIWEVPNLGIAFSGIAIFGGLPFLGCLVLAIHYFPIWETQIWQFPNLETSGYWPNLHFTSSLSVVNLPLYRLTLSYQATLEYI